MGTRERNRALVRERLLDTAEQLFADQGFAAVSVRDITAAAGLRLAAVNDSFGSKENLFRQVILRRAEVLNAERSAALDHPPRSATTAERLRWCVDAFARPYLVHGYLVHSAESEGWRNYIRLVAQLTPARQRVLLTVADQYNPMATRFIAALRETLPGCDEARLHRAYEFMVTSTLTFFSPTHRLDILTDGEVRSDDVAAHYDILLDFLTGGFLALKGTS
ncbi:TetR/AcrR family transcriptional regulator [Actinokineospora iranica]|uniref:Regulatory protein, tetR family n=1 Tax=Actinokineospora iranica TaxID=1271860 RepID=A0A1G6TR97_9PSEU|nr:TetR/AcrR family transcriptional regulator [Actinokineospora iranica]SDD31434.1 regulatory protein, tetR family [Actinokineospora iranica]